MLYKQDVQHFILYFTKSKITEVVMKFEMRMTWAGRCQLLENSVQKSLMESYSFIHSEMIVVSTERRKLS